MTIDQVNPESTDVTSELYKSVIGARNQAYYLRCFSKFDADGKTGMTWNWSASVLTLNWLVFRKMWPLALWYVSLSIAVALLVFGIGKLVFNYSETTELALGALFLLATSVPPGLYANAAYYRFCEKKITKALVSDVGVQGASELLARQASSGRRLAALTVLNLAFLVVLLGLLSLVPGLNVFEKLQQASSDLMSSNTAAPPEIKLTIDTPARLVPAVPASASIVVAATPAVVAASAPAPVAPGSAPVPPVAATEEVISSAKAVMIEVSAPPAPALASSLTPVAERDQPKAKANTVIKPVQHYFLQVGAYADEGNASKVIVKLESIGLSPVVQGIDGAKGRLTQIRVGPFDTRAQARKAAEKIEELGLPALFVKL